jgi:hypothetical protein
MAIFGVIAAAVLVVAGFGLYGLSEFNKSYVMTFEGKRISNNDFLFSIMSVLFSDTEDPKADAFDQLLEVLVLESRARGEGISLTDEDRADMESWAAELQNMYAMNGLDMSFISTGRIAEILATEVYYEQLMDIHTADLEINQADFERAFADYMENNKADYYEMTFKYAFNLFPEMLEEAKAELGTVREVDGESEEEATVFTFDDLVAEQCVMYDPEQGINTALLWQLGLSEEDARIAVGLEEGDVSPVFIVDDYALLLQVATKNIPPDGDVEADFRERFTSERRAEAFRAIIQTWKTEADYTLNQRGYDAV